RHLGIETVADLQLLDLAILENIFGRFGRRLHELARGIDHSTVVSNRLAKSISSEDTLEHDLLLTQTEPIIRSLAERVWAASRKELRIPHTVLLKLKTSEFNILTRSHSPYYPPSSCEELTDTALWLRQRVHMDAQQRFRLVGVGLTNFREVDESPVQPPLFD